MLETYTIYIYTTSSCISVCPRSSLWFSLSRKANDCEKLCGAIQCLLATKESGSSVGDFGVMEPLKQFQGFIKNVTQFFPGGIKQAAKLAQIYMVISSGISRMKDSCIFADVRCHQSTPAVVPSISHMGWFTL